MSTSSDWSWDRGAEVDALRVGGRVGSYEVLGTLGRGTTSRVFRVRDPAGRELALKVLGSATPSSVKRFELEGKVTASLRHPGIVAVYAAGEVGGHPYLVYELVSGATLAERLPDLGRAARLNVVLQVAQALGYAHAQGVLHRDVKAENVIVDGNGQARVVDFGLALVVGTERMTRTGAWVGSPSYMSPEQIAGHRDRFGPPTDVWGLGVLLYTVLAGRVPFDGQSVVELMAQIAGATPPPLREFDPDCSPELEAVCLRALAKAPAQRYADGAAFAAALEQAIQQPGASTGARWVRRGAVALALTLALGGVLWGAGTGGPPAADSDKPSPRIDEGADVLERARAALAADDALGAIALLEPVVARALS
ncbi:MAG: serine/threonine protein kinase, partial [Planctomycetes bacterium]|nr:serine/threonine protein kinase [Planctomycetota bacterium]